MAAALIKRKSHTLWKCDALLSTPQKMKGLMFKQKTVPLFFVFDAEATFSNAIHSFFCPPFDAVFLDEHKRVVDVRKNITPWKAWIAPKKPAKYLLELPAGDASRKRVREGETLTIVLK